MRKTLKIKGFERVIYAIKNTKIEIVEREQKVGNGVAMGHLTEKRVEGLDADLDLSNL